MRFHVREAELALTDCHTRLPFRFGITTLTFAPTATARVLVESETGDRTVGYAADLLVPKWFEKDAAKSARDDVETLIASARDASSVLTGGGPAAATVFDHWWRLYETRVGSRPEDAPDLLVRGFGVAILERALMDAACRAAGLAFHEALRRDLFGFEPGRLHPELARWSLAASLAPEPATSVDLRHTVGLVDALRRDEVVEADRVRDGGPESLEEDIDRHGLRWFKIKLGGDRDADLARLDAIASVIEAGAGDAARVTLDGNEQFADLADLATLLDALAGSPRGAFLLARLVAIEQPLARARTFDVAPNAAMPDVTRFAPVIIDEADAHLASFPRAVELGYRGVSVKNCKGVFRALANRGLCDRSEGRLFQSAEDLTNLPVLALQQDLATVATLGLGHVERNGHHYFRGLDHLPPAEAEAALAAHPDLYVRDAPGRVGLRVSGGSLALGSLGCPGYGYDVPIAFTARTPVDAWSWPRGET